MNRTALIWVMLFCSACPREHTPITSATVVHPEPRAEVSPSGRWMADGVEHSGCVDCPTPRFAAVLGQGTLDAVEAQAASFADLSVGYPMLVFPHELGWREEGTRSSTVLIVGAMFPTAQDAEIWARTRSESCNVREILWHQAQPTPLVARARRAAPGYDEELIRQTSGNPETAEPLCVVPAGTAAVVADIDFDQGDVFRIPDASPWLRMPCHGVSVMVRAANTDFGLIVRRDGDQIIETQYDGGVCGVRYFHRRLMSAQGQMVSEAHLATGRCFDQPASDSWGICPRGSIEGCRERAEQVWAQGSDPLRAARLAAYACHWGSPMACPLRWDIDLSRGVPAAEVLAAAVSFCPFDDQAHSWSSAACTAVDRLLRGISPEQLVDGTDAERGMVGREGCLRAIPGWCDILSTSRTCDLDGCG